MWCQCLYWLIFTTTFVLHAQVEHEQNNRVHHSSSERRPNSAPHQNKVKNAMGPNHCKRNVDCSAGHICSDHGLCIPFYFGSKTVLSGIGSRTKTTTKSNSDQSLTVQHYSTLSHPTPHPTRFKTKSARPTNGYVTQQQEPRFEGFVERVADRRATGTKSEGPIAASTTNSTQFFCDSLTDENVIAERTAVAPKFEKGEKSYHELRHKKTLIFFSLILLNEQMKSQT